MGYTSKNTAGKLVQEVPVMVEGLNASPSQAFKCAEIYLDHLKKKGIVPGIWGYAWLYGIWFRKYRFMPLLIGKSDLRGTVKIPKKALKEFYSKELKDIIVPKLWAILDRR